MRLLLVSSGLACGCATDGTSNSLSNAAQKTARSLKPASDDTSNSKKGDDDDWNEVGRQARGDRKMDKENDPLRNWFVSPQAQDIERSLGVD